ncbi:hypothetical protein DSO57_1004998 [Entomophthora muscae]|uniref:Uncharacterized protein n=1 Tax=Entomophthora muscae TaxID=34485 RepID=A0ACC2SX28_9FUNG|nr:hypothetical protein DSO57_1004998 [Entomophthora muscae]
MNKADKNNAFTPKPRGGVHPLIMLAVPTLMTLSLASVLHFHQFEYIHQTIPNLLSNFVPEGKIPLALLGLQYVFTYYFTAFLAVFSRASFCNEGYNNNYPRRDKNLLTGIAARMQGAHENTLEVFPAFASAVIVGTICEIPQEKLIYFSTCYNLARFGHTAVYACNVALPRSVLFHIGSMSTLLIYLFSVVNNFDIYFQQLCKHFLATPF